MCDECSLKFIGDASELNDEFFSKVPRVNGDAIKHLRIRQIPNNLGNVYWSPGRENPKPVKPEDLISGVYGYEIINAEQMLGSYIQQPKWAECVISSTTTLFIPCAPFLAYCLFRKNDTVNR
jgi:hypothetical protein